MGDKERRMARTHKLSIDLEVRSLVMWALVEIQASEEATRKAHTKGRRVYDG